MSLVWREQLSVGNDAIDADHKRLIEIINMVEPSLGTGNRRTLSVALTKLSQYSQEHFVREERIAAAAGYPQVPQMHQSHEALNHELDKIRHEIGQTGDEWPAARIEHFTKLLRDWLLQHVIHEDLLMKPTLQKLPPAFTAK